MGEKGQLHLGYKKSYCTFVNSLGIECVNTDNHILKIYHAGARTRVTMCPILIFFI